VAGFRDPMPNGTPTISYSCAITVDVPAGHATHLAKDAPMSRITGPSDTIGVAGPIETHESSDCTPSDGPNIFPLRDLPHFVENLTRIDAMAEPRRVILPA
jgi:3-deoxy-D-manno-octulosonic acid (KDO) 8-phosphate synthase